MNLTRRLNYLASQLKDEFLKEANKKEYNKYHTVEDLQRALGSSYYLYLVLVNYIDNHYRTSEDAKDDLIAYSNLLYLVLTTKTATEYLNHKIAEKLNAYKTIIPKNKSEFCQLENSVRKMW